MSFMHIFHSSSGLTIGSRSLAARYLLSTEELVLDAILVTVPLIILRFLEVKL
jgi:hypothetical protein